MRTLKRNKVKVWYRLYTGETEIENISGIRTGEYRKTYSAPTYVMANLAPATGEAYVEPFGVETNYSHIMVVEGTDCPITETTVLWTGTDTAPDKQYRVKRIAKSLNHIRYALEEIEATLEPYEEVTQSEQEH